MLVRSSLSCVGVLVWVLFIISNFITLAETRTIGCNSQSDCGNITCSGTDECVVNCGGNGCRNINFTCLDRSTCTLNCPTSKTCYFATYVCSNAANCTINCGTKTNSKNQACTEACITPNIRCINSNCNNLITSQTCNSYQQTNSIPISFTCPLPTPRQGWNCINNTLYINSSIDYSDSNLQDTFLISQPVIILGNFTFSNVSLIFSLTGSPSTSGSLSTPFVANLYSFLALNVSSKNLNIQSRHVLVTAGTLNSNVRFDDVTITSESDNGCTQLDSVVPSSNSLSVLLNTQPGNCDVGNNNNNDNKSGNNNKGIIIGVVVGVVALAVCIVIVVGVVVIVGMMLQRQKARRSKGSVNF
eukprot:TRINITY_DN1706_c1_g2_i1.p1 TRINITY_DN1706_c1_g2~~TRINITY_DN1706_c1_g2_i1.p1  ORF type:complete len:358 (+),score=46.25 TRINITY_DN1706_c1_g2_i1:35-1108(+)